MRTQGRQAAHAPRHDPATLGQVCMAPGPGTGWKSLRVTDTAACRRRTAANGRRGMRLVALLSFLFALYGSQSIAADLMRVKLKGSDLEDKTCEELRFMRNEIYARHGRKFANPKIHEYFLNQDWYRPRFEPSVFPNDKITDIQKANIVHIEHFEDKKGCRNPKPVFDFNQWSILEWSAALVGLAALLTIIETLRRIVFKRARGEPDPTESP